jgi:nicotinamide mononucleotide transporter
MSIYGWILWTRSKDGGLLQITRSTAKDWSITFGIFLSTALLVTAVYLYFDRFDRFTDYTDTLTTGIFFAAMWMLANKKTEHWILWIVANSISIPLYLTKGLGFTAIQYSVFLVLAIQGWYIWQKNLKKEK